jgi:tellurite resistance protein
LHKFAAAKVHLMLYQLQKLSSEEQTSVKRSPIWVTLLVACADYDIQEKEIDRAKEIIHIKSYALQNDLKNLYKELDANIEQEIDQALAAIPAGGNDRIQYLEEKISELNPILGKLDSTFNKQLYKSLKSVALAVAQSDGGLFGVGRISDEEERYISLPMLKKP